MLHSWRHALQALGLVGYWIQSGASVRVPYTQLLQAPGQLSGQGLLSGHGGHSAPGPCGPVGHAERTDTGMQNKIRVAFLPVTLYGVVGKAGLSDSRSGPNAVSVEAGIRGLFSLPSSLCFLTCRRGWQCLPLQLSWT